MAQPTLVTVSPSIDTPVTIVADLLKAGFHGGFLEWAEITELSGAKKDIPKELWTYPAYVAYSFIWYDYAVRLRHKTINKDRTYHYGFDRIRWALQALIADRFDDYVKLRRGEFSQELADWFIQQIAFWGQDYDPKTGAELPDSKP